jgi:glycosyltransferase involved in cell wall biosynthesis
MQKTDFDFKLIIGEDCSTDRTRLIVADYVNKYPDKIRPIFREKNIGLMPNFIDLIGVCNSSEYLAWLEGDDFWTDPLKLQKQIDFLDHNPGFTMSSHNAGVMMEDKIVKSYCKPNHPAVIDLEYLLTYGSGGPTCSLVIRNKAIKKLPDWFWKIPAGDWAIQIVAAESGKMKYFPYAMATYRRHGKSALYHQKKEAQSKGESDFCIPSKRTLAMIDLLDGYFDNKYSELLKIQKIYWYDLYVAGYLEIGDINAAKTYFYKMIPILFTARFWRYPSIPMNRIAKLFMLALPALILKIIIKNEAKNH